VDGEVVKHCRLEMDIRLSNILRKADPWKLPSNKTHRYFIVYKPRVKWRYRSLSVRNKVKLLGDLELWFFPQLNSRHWQVRYATCRAIIATNNKKKVNYALFERCKTSEAFLKKVGNRRNKAATWVRCLIRAKGGGDYTTKPWRSFNYWRPCRDVCLQVTTSKNTSPLIMGYVGPKENGGRSARWLPL